MADRVGQQFGDYRLLRLIGKGGFADVYLGEHARRKSLAAIKVLHERLAQDNLKSFLNEARSFRLKHSHIVQILDFGLEDDYPYLVMEYAPNGSLRQRHPKGTQVPLATIVTYVKQVADALQYAHDEGVVHRDIKPDNMLLGKSDEVLLSDFGIASIAQTATSLNLRDQAGTVSYMAPEQLQGKPRPASDQYSLGIVVYEWICGDRPFSGTFFEIHGQHLNASPPSLRAHIPDLHANIEEVIMTALAKDPRSRFASIKTFANALEQAYLSAQSPTTTLYPEGKTVPKPEPAHPVEIKPMRQMPAQQPAMLTEVLPPRVEPGTAGEQKPAQKSTSIPQPTILPLPPVIDYTPSRAQPSPNTLSMPVAAPDTYTTSKPTTPTPGSPPKRTGSRNLLIVALLVITLLLLASIVFASPLGQNALHALTGSTLTTTITITPDSKLVSDNFVITAVTGTPNPSARQVQASILSYTTPPGMASAPATGSIPGRQATGTLVFINTGVSGVNVSAGILTGKDGVQISFGSFFVPVGSANVLGTAVNTGVSGNIRALDIYGTCCGGLLVRNPNSFSGGQNAIPNSVITQNDINSASNNLISKLKPSAQAALQKMVQANEQVVNGTLNCTTNTTADHKSGDRASSVTVTGTATCTEEVFDKQMALSMATDALKAEAAKNPGAGYALVGNVVASVTQATVIDAKHTVSLVVAAQGEWVYQFTPQLQQALKDSIANKTKSDATTILQKTAGVSSFTIDISSGSTMPAAADITLMIKSLGGVNGTPTSTTGSPTVGTTPTGAPTATPTPTTVVGGGS